MEFQNTYGNSLAKGNVGCPSCSHRIAYYDDQRSEYYGCSACGTYFREEGSDRKEILGKFRKKVSIGVQYIQPELAIPDIAVGNTCSIDGIEYILTGFLMKQQKGDYARWQEYLLFNAADEYYLTLAEYNGHWTLIRRSKDQLIQSTTYNATSVDGDFSRYLSYKFEVLQATGEFNWNVLDDEMYNVSEYVQPPKLLVKEMKHDVPEWYEGEYHTRAQIASYFNMSKSQLPRSRGFSPLRAHVFDAAYWPVIISSVLMMILVIIINAVFSVAMPEKQLLSYTVEPVQDSTGWSYSKIAVTPPFNVQGPAALQIDINTGLDNEWLEVPMTLVNETTGETYEFTRAIEYYSGVEGGESWSEGSKTNEIILSRMPSGTYHINLELYGEEDKGRNINVSVIQNAFLTSNALIMILLLAICPVLLHMRKNMLEQ